MNRDEITEEEALNFDWASIIVDPPEEFPCGMCDIIARGLVAGEVDVEKLREASNVLAKHAMRDGRIVLCDAHRAQWALGLEAIRAATAE